MRGGGARVGIGTRTMSRIRIWARVWVWVGSTVAATRGVVVVMLVVLVMVVVVVNRGCSSPACNFPNAVLQIRYTANTRARAWVRVKSRAGWRHLRLPPPSWKHTRARVRARARVMARARVRAGEQGGPRYSPSIDVGGGVSVLVGP